MEVDKVECRKGEGPPNVIEAVNLGHETADQAKSSEKADESEKVDVPETVENEPELEEPEKVVGNEKADEPEKAAAAYRVATKAYPNSSFAFLAARRAARLLALDKKTPQPAAPYAALLQQFPQPQDRAAPLFDWHACTPHPHAPL